MNRSALLPALLVPLGLLSGCCLPLDPPPPETVVDVQTLIGEYNANARKVSYFRAEARVQATIYSEAGVSLLRYGGLEGPPNSTILFSRDQTDPAAVEDFTFYVRETTQKVFGAGVSSLDGLYYYFLGLGEQSRAAVGRVALAGAPGVEGLPLDPLQLVSVFALSPLPDDLSTMPTVVQRLKMDCPYAYVLSVIDRRPVSGQAVAKREMYFTWDVEKPRRLYKIVYVDDRGRHVMEAELEDFQPVDTSELPDPPAEPPVLPWKMKLTWFSPKSGKRSARLEIALKKAHTPDLLYVEAVRPSHIVPKSLLRGARLIDAELSPMRDRPGREDGR